ncbi:hypothetical protein CRG98_046163 [Punica granatum]|uniref:Uncharacterized protein n=1 Tax=Punica granatum TaxID=22663 RepID=A0A2I0HQ91_PUNGR|nr:hypothetical protein CRG98_046163 [Punica granatum]
MTPERLRWKPEKRGGHRGSSDDSTWELFALKTSWLAVKGGSLVVGARTASPVPRTEWESTWSQIGGVEGKIDELRVEGMSCGFVRRGRMRESKVVGAEKAVSSGQSKSVGCGRRIGEEAAAEEEEAGEEEEEARVFAGAEGPTERKTELSGSRELREESIELRAKARE